MTKLLRLLLIRDDEKITVLYFLSFFFTVGCGMAMGKASADALFLKRFGIEYLPVMYIALGGLLAAISFLYAAFADRVSAERYFFRLLVVLMVSLLVIWAIIYLTASAAIYPVYFLIYEAASEIILIHSALYLWQNLDTLKSKRLSPIIMAGSQLGLIAGGTFAAVLAPSIGTGQIILIWCLLLSVSCLMLLLWHKRHGTSAYYYKQHARSSMQQSILQIKQGISFSLQSSLLRAASLAFFFLVITFYILYYLTNQIYTNHFHSVEELTAFFGLLTALTGLTALLLQVFISNRSIEKFGVQKTNLIYPAAMTLGFINLTLALKFPGAIIGSFIKDSLGPAFNKPVSNMMLNILPGNIQVRSRAFFIGIILPIALLVSAIILLVAQSLQDPYYFVIPGLITSVLLLIFSLLMNKAYIKTLIQHLREQVYLPEQALSEDSKQSMLNALENNIQDANDKLTISCAKILIQSHPKKAVNLIIERLKKTQNNSTFNQLMHIVAQHSAHHLSDCLRHSKNYPLLDTHNKATLHFLLFQNKDHYAKQFAPSLLDHKNPRMIAVGIFGIYAYQLDQHIAQAVACWKKLSRETGCYFLPALQLCDTLKHTDKSTQAELVNNYLSEIPVLLQSDKPHWKKQALESLVNWEYGHTPALKQGLDKLLQDSDPYIRSAAINCCHILSFTDHMSMLIAAFEDGHSLVRKTAIKSLLSSSRNTETIANQWLNNDESFITPRAQQSMLYFLLENGLTENTLLQLADTKAKLARQYYDAVQIVKPHKDENTAFFLIYTTLTERLKQSCKLLLNILDQLDHSNIIPSVKAAINSNDKQLIASACEAIRSIKNKKISSVLVDILQDSFELKRNYQLTFNDLADTINWCSLQDEWLHICSNRVLNHD